MRILVLGYLENTIIDCIKQTDEVTVTDERVNLEEVKTYDPDLIISYGYKYILRPPVVQAYPGSIINLHISYLPWNRGYHPNFWSFYEDTPKGVTIHYIDEGIDTGDILLQKIVEFTPEEDTLVKTYDRLRQEIEELFIENWYELRRATIQPKTGQGGGSHHFRRELDLHWTRLSQAWDTKTQEVADLGVSDR